MARGLLVTVTLLMASVLVTSACAGEAATPTPIPSQPTTGAPAQTAGPSPEPTTSPMNAPTPLASLGFSPLPSQRPVPTPSLAPKPTVAASPTPTPKPIALKLSMGYPEQSTRGIQAKKFKELLERYTDGRMTVELFMGGVLFPTRADWEAVTTKAVDMTFTPPFFARGPIPQNAVWYVAQIWESAEHGWAVLQDGRVPKIFKSLFADKGIELLGIFPSGTYFATISRKKELKAYPDMKGLKYGLPPGQPLRIFTEYAKAVATPVNATEAYLALAQGVIDIYAQQPSTIVAAKLYEVADYAFISPFGYGASLLLMNKDAFNALPGDIQSIILNKVMPEAQSFANDLILESEKKDIETIRKNVKAVHYATPEDLSLAAEVLKNDPPSKKDLEDVGAQILNIIDDLRLSRKPK